METKRVVPQQQVPISDATKSDELGNTMHVLEKSVAPDVSYIIAGEALRSLIDERIDKKPKSWLQTISSNALVVVVVGGMIMTFSRKTVPAKNRERRAIME